MGFNPVSALYEISENEIVYGITLELTRSLKTFARAGTLVAAEPLVASWYKSLDKASKKLVVRTGNVPDTANDFYPDPEFD